MLIVKTLRILALLALANLNPAEAAVDVTRPIAEVRLSDGTVYRNVLIISFAERTIMARWEGGRGTIAVADLPAEVRNAVLATARERNRAREISPASESKPPVPKPAGTPFDKIVSHGFDVKVYERNDYYVRVAWKATVVNKSSEPMRLRANLLVVDERNFKLDEEHSDRFLLEPGKSHEVSESSLVETGIFDQMKTWKLELERI